MRADGASGYFSRLDPTIPFSLLRLQGTVCHNAPHKSHLISR